MRKKKEEKLTIPRLELGISRVSGERVSHCTIQSITLFIDPFYTRIASTKEKNHTYFDGKECERKSQEERRGIPFSQLHLVYISVVIPNWADSGNCNLLFS